MPRTWACKASHPYAGISALGVKAQAEVHSFKDFQNFLGGLGAKKIASNVWIVVTEGTAEEPEAISVRLYETNILTYFRDGRWVADNGGFHTITTSNRATQFGPGPRFYHYQKVLKPQNGRTK